MMPESGYLCLAGVWSCPHHGRLRLTTGCTVSDCTHGSGTLNGNSCDGMRPLAICPCLLHLLDLQGSGQCMRGTAGGARLGRIRHSQAPPCCRCLPAARVVAAAARGARATKSQSRWAPPWPHRQQQAGRSGHRPRHAHPTSTAARHLRAWPHRWRTCPVIH